MPKYLEPVETKIINGKEFNVFRSPDNMMIRKVGTEEIYSEAVDLAYLNHKYVKTDIEIVVEIIESTDEEWDDE